MPSKSAIPTLSDFEKTATDAIDNSKKKQDETVAKDTSKPALAKKMISAYGKYIFLGISAIGIVYKMFFVDVDQPRRKYEPQKKIPVSQQRLEKKGKTKVENSSSIPKINMQDSNEINGQQNFKSLPIVDTPAVPVLKLPSVPDISDDIKKSELSAANDQQHSLSLPPPPVIEASKASDQKQLNNKNKGQQQGQVSSAEKQNPEIAKASHDMFLVKSQGTVNNNPNRNQNQYKAAPKGGPRDFIIFDGSGLTTRTGNMEDKISSTQVSNLSNTLATGKMVEAVLETAIDSENQGPIRAVVSKDVYGETGSEVLVPKGSRLYGTYSTQITPGQSRVAVMFSRILRPDGVSIAISAEAGDQIGRSGIAGDVDSRYFEMLQNSLLLSFLTLGTAVVTEKVFGLNGQSQVVNNNGSVATTNITPGNAAAQSMINTASTIAKDMASTLAQKIQPVISVPHGYLIVLTVNKDIVIPKYRMAGRVNTSDS